MLIAGTCAVANCRVHFKKRYTNTNRYTHTHTPIYKETDATHTSDRTRALLRQLQFSTNANCDLIESVCPRHAPRTPALAMAIAK